MTDLGTALGDYLRLRRGLGYYLERDETELEKFVRFLDQAGAEHITTELALRWARMPASSHPIIWRRRLSVVRQFARYLATVDPDSEIPSKDLLPAHQPRTAPYIYYAPEEIARVMAAARSLRRLLTAALFETVIGLMASTGVRLREALALDREDVDLQAGVLDLTSARARITVSATSCCIRALRPRWAATPACETSTTPRPRRQRSSSPTSAGGQSRRCSGRRSAR